jgi:alkylation response protein AidB-like acyl-CoA dehydrogenase
MTDTDELRALREAVADLLDKRSPESRVRELMATDTGYDETTWQELADMGLLGLAVPESYGGTGAGHIEMGVVAEELGRTLLCAPFLSTAVLAPALLTAIGGDAESEVLAGIAAGSLIVTLAYAEGPSALIPEQLSTRANAGESGWSLTGAKNYVLDGAAADLFYVLAESPDGPAVFAVERNTPGLTVTMLDTIDLTRKQCTLRLDATPARRVGDPGCGATSFASALQAASVALVSEQAGGTYRAMRMGAEYARTRFQFGRAIGSFQAVKHMCADMLIEAESAVSAARHVAAAFDNAAPNRFADLALAQGYCAEAFVNVCAANIQVHGGIGFTWEHPAHLYLRRARTDAQLFGDTAHHRERYLQLKGA